MWDTNKDWQKVLLKSIKRERKANQEADRIFKEMKMLDLNRAEGGINVRWGVTDGR